MKSKEYDLSYAYSKGFCCYLYYTKANLLHGGVSQMVTLSSLPQHTYNPSHSEGPLKGSNVRICMNVYSDYPNAVYINCMQFIQTTQSSCNFKIGLETS